MGVELRLLHPSQIEPLPHPPLGWSVWLPRAAARSFFSSVSFSAVFPCWVPVCVCAEVGEWTGGGVCGVIRVCGLQRKNRKKGRKLTFTAGPLMLSCRFALSELYHNHEWNHTDVLTSAAGLKLQVKWSLKMSFNYFVNAGEFHFCVSCLLQS